MRILLQIILIFQVMVAAGQVGVHTDFPDNSSAMDIVATNRGLLIPRVILTATLTNPSPITAPAVGLLVFNSGANQPIGFYYWNGSTWVQVGGSSGGGSGWSLTGNAGTIPGTNFLGTTDNQHFLVFSNNTERMRFESDGQVIIGNTVPNNSTDLFTVFGNSTQNAAINAYSPRTGFQTSGGRYGILSTVDTAAGFALYARNLDALGYGIVTVGSAYTTVGLISSHTAGTHTQGYDGLHAWGKDANGFGIFAMGSNATGPFNLSSVSAGLSAVGNYGIITKGSSATGRGIVAVGSGIAAPSTSNESEGGAFAGHHGIYAKGSGSVEPLGIGVIGIGYNVSTYSIIPGRSLGGSFTGNYGIYGKAVAADGVGVIGLGSNGTGYYTVTNGSGGAFTGYHGLLGVGNNTVNGIGVIGGGNNGVYTIPPSGAGGSFTGTITGAIGFGTNTTGGIGIVGAGNGAGAIYPNNGAGGAFSGNVGIYSLSTASNGIGVIGLGNNIFTPGTFANGAGGTFTGTAAGAVGWGTNIATGTGILGAGNNITTLMTYTTGSGGAFTGTDAGSVSWATGSSGTGVIGVSNNSAYFLISNGSGSSFSGYHGSVAKAINAAAGTGVVGLGNNLTSPILLTNGGGGSFTGTYTGVVGNATLVDNASIGVLGQYYGSGANNNNDGIGVKGIAITTVSRGYGVYGQGNRYGLYSNGNTGASGTKQFVIDHPLDPENKILRHYSVESPEILNMYRGNVILDGAGEATILLPDYFTRININYSYDLTAIGSSAPNLFIKKEIDNNGNFSISGGNPGQKISWVVYAERNDLFVQQEGERAVEVVKDEYQKGKYIMPELYNQPPEKGIFYSDPGSVAETFTAEGRKAEIIVSPPDKIDKLVLERNESKLIEAESSNLSPVNESLIPAEQIHLKK